MTREATARIITLSDGQEHTIPVRILDTRIICGQTFYAWEPAGELAGSLAEYNGWGRGALVLPASRVSATDA